MKQLAVALAKKIEAELHEEVQFISGFRDPEKQKALYEQGRSLPGQIVSWAKPFFSFHNYGLAFDLAPTRLLRKPGWDPKNPLWSKIGRIAESIGLEWGGRWSKPDRPHFEFHPGLTIREVFAHFKKTGEIIVSKVLRPEILILIALGVIWFATYYEKRIK